MPTPQDIASGRLITPAASRPQCFSLSRVYDNTECFFNNSPLPLFPYSNSDHRSTALAKTSLSNRSIPLLLTATLKVTKSRVQPPPPPPLSSHRGRFLSSPLLSFLTVCHHRHVIGEDRNGFLSDTVWARHWLRRGRTEGGVRRDADGRAAIAKRTALTSFSFAVFSPQSHNMVRFNAWPDRA